MRRLPRSKKLRVIKRAIGLGNKLKSGSDDVILEVRAFMAKHSWVRGHKKVFGPLRKALQEVI